LRKKKYEIWRMYDLKAYESFHFTSQPNNIKYKIEKVRNFLFHTVVRFFFLTLQGICGEKLFENKTRVRTFYLKRSEVTMAWL
jgi:hypothetical protein